MSALEPLPDLHPLSLKFEFVGSYWANCHMAAGDWRHTIEAFGACGFDTFADFLLAAVNEDAGGLRPSLIQFEFEPGLIELTIEKRYHPLSPGGCYTVITAADYMTRPYGRTTDGSGETLFEICLEFGSFAKAVAAAFASCAEAPEDEFEKHWEIPFPEKAYRALSASLNSENRHSASREFGGSVAVISNRSEKNNG